MNNEFEVITIELQGRTITQLHNEIDDLLSGSLECVGGGMMIGSTKRDMEIVANTKQEIKDFRERLIRKGYILEPSTSSSSEINEDNFNEELNTMIEDLDIKKMDGDEWDDTHEAIAHNQELELDKVQEIINLMFELYPMDLDTRAYMGDMEIILRMEMKDTNTTPKQMLEDKLYLSQTIMAYYVSNIGEVDDVIYNEISNLKELHVNSYIGMVEWLEIDD